MNRMEKLSLGVVKQGLAIQHLLLMWIFRNPGSLMARVSFTNPLFKPSRVTIIGAPLDGLMHRNQFQCSILAISEMPQNNHFPKMTREMTKTFREQPQRPIQKLVTNETLVTFLTIEINNLIVHCDRIYNSCDMVSKVCQ